MSGLRLKGTEEWTVEMTGSIPTQAVAGALVGVEPWSDDGRVEVGLLVFGMRGLALRGVPGPGLDYREALWRLAVAVDGVPGWLAHTCDLDRSLVRFFGRRLIRYPARAASIEIERTDERWRLSVSAAGRLGAALELTEHAPDPEPPRPVLVIDGGRPYAVPWAQDPAPFRRRATVSITDDGLSSATLGAEVAWRPGALVHCGRTHHCGFATRR